jgi:hypothetical protein
MKEHRSFATVSSPGEIYFFAAARTRTGLEKFDDGWGRDFPTERFRKPKLLGAITHEAFMIFSSRVERKVNGSPYRIFNDKVAKN